MCANKILYFLFSKSYIEFKKESYIMDLQVVNKEILLWGYCLAISLCLVSNIGNQLGVLLVAMIKD